MAYYTKICVLKACLNRNLKITKNTDIKRHSFPKDPACKKKWEDFVNKHNFTSSFKAYKGALLCSAHFTIDSYRQPNGKLLKIDALPTIAPEFSPESAFRWGLSPCLEESGFPYVLTETNSAEPDANCVRAGEIPQKTVQIISPVTVANTEVAVKVKVEAEKEANTIVDSDPVVESGGAILLQGTPAERSTLQNPPVISQGQEVHDSRKQLDGVTRILGKLPFPRMPTQTKNLVTSGKDTGVIVHEEMDVNSCGPGHTLDTTGESVNLPLTPVRSPNGKRYVGDLSPGDFATPKRAWRSLQIVQKTLNSTRHRLQMSQQRQRRARKKLTSLLGLLQTLHRERKITADTSKSIKVHISNLKRHLGYL